MYPFWTVIKTFIANSNTILNHLIQVIGLYVRVLPSPVTVHVYKHQVFTHLFLALAAFTLTSIETDFFYAHMLNWIMFFMIINFIRIPTRRLVKEILQYLLPHCITFLIHTWVCYAVSIHLWVFGWVFAVDGGMLNGRVFQAWKREQREDGKIGDAGYDGKAGVLCEFLLIEVFVYLYFKLKCFNVVTYTHH